MKQHKKQKWERWEDMHPDAQAAIIAEIEQGGFGSELKARHIFSEEGFDTKVIYFHDFDEDKTRELDIFSESTSPRVHADKLRTRPRLDHRIYAEVKSGYTWVLGDSQNEESFTFEESEGVDYHAPKWFKEGLKRHGGQDSRSENEWNELHRILLGEPLRAGLRASSLFQHRGSECWYEAAVKVAKASYEKNLYSNDDLLVVVPLVILDGNLLEAEFYGGILCINPCDRVKIRFKYVSQMYEMREVDVHVVTMKGLPELLRSIRKAGIAASGLIELTYWRGLQMAEDDDEF